MADLDFGGTFGFDRLGNIGGSQLAVIGIVILIAILIFALVGFIVYKIYHRKVYKYRIHVFQNVGNVPTRIGFYKAKAVPVGRAGDQLWFVGGIKKYLPVPNIQSATSEYWYWIREDGEWINFGLGDLDDKQRKAGVKYIHQDMRMQRLATDRLLEQRLMQKSFWEKWSTTIMTVMFFLIIAIALTIFMYMFGKNIQNMNALTNNIAELMDKAEGKPSGQIIPEAIVVGIPTLLFRRKRKSHSLIGSYP